MQLSIANPAGRGLAISLQNLSAGFVEHAAAGDRSIMNLLSCQRSTSGPLRKSNLTDISKRAFVSGPTMQLSIAKFAEAGDQPSKACSCSRSIDHEPAAGSVNPLRGSHVHACLGIKMGTETQ